MKTKIDRYWVSWELTERQWEKLDSLDCLTVVLPRLEKFGALQVEYDGHFGRTVYCLVDSLDSAEKIRLELQKILK